MGVPLKLHELAARMPLERHEIATGRDESSKRRDAQEARRSADKSNRGSSILWLVILASQKGTG
jgi:hypothetical protein